MFNPDKYQDLFSGGYDNRPYPIEERQVEICLEFLKLVRKTKTAKRLNSYNLKHLVEAWARTKIEFCGDNYVSNGAFIYAAFETDFAISRISGSPNVYVGISTEDVRKIG